MQPDAIDVDLADLHRCKATICFQVPNFSKLTEGKYSPPVYVRGLAWSIFVVPIGAGKEKTLGFYMKCGVKEAGSPVAPNWSCAANVELRIKTQKPPISDFKQSFEQVFRDKNSPSWGLEKFMEWSKICDPSWGFVKDDTVILEADVHAEMPNGIPLSSKSHVLQMKRWKQFQEAQKFTDTKLTVK